MPCNELTDRADGLTEAVTCIRQWKISDLLVDLAIMIDLLQVTLRSKGPSVKVCDHAWPHGSYWVDHDLTFPMCHTDAIGFRGSDFIGTFIIIVCNQLYLMQGTKCLHSSL
jgi:hypothetical protein